MPKKVKFSLNSIKIQSFVTSLDKSEEQKVKGGDTIYDLCGNTEVGFTCNFKCGNTGYWECG